MEACGVRGSVLQLMKLACEDGRSPFMGPASAHGRRVGSVGPGGVCHNILDLYEIPCPEKTYEVYVDIYVCADMDDFM